MYKDTDKFTYDDKMGRKNEKVSLFNGKLIGSSLSTTSVKIDESSDLPSLLFSFHLNPSICNIYRGKASIYRKKFVDPDKFFFFDSD